MLPTLFYSNGSIFKGRKKNNADFNYFFLRISMNLFFQYFPVPRLSLSYVLSHICPCPTFVPVPCLSCILCLSLSYVCLSYVCLSYVCLSYVCLSYVCLSYVCLSYVCLSHVCSTSYVCPCPTFVCPMFVLVLFLQTETPDM